MGDVQRTVKKQKEICNCNTRIKDEEVAKELGVSHGLTFSIVHDSFDPFSFQKNTRLKIYRKLLKHNEDYADLFIKRTIIVNETCFHYFGPENKDKLGLRNIPFIPQQKRQNHAAVEKLMMTVFWNIEVRFLFISHLKVNQ